MKVSKQLAHEIAIKVTEPLQVKIKELKKQYEILMTKQYSAAIPKDVLEFFSKYPKVVMSRTSIYIDGLRYIQMSEAMPDWDFTPTRKQRDELLKMYGQIEDAKEKRNKTVLEIENSILALGTYARIKEQLPEVYNYLPVPENRSIAINLQPVRTKIKMLQKQSA